MPRSEQKTRKPLTWETLVQLDYSPVRAEIQGAQGDKGFLYSVTIGRVKDRNGEQYLDRHLQSRDLAKAAEALREAEQWIECDKEERAEKRGKQMRNMAYSR